MLPNPTERLNENSPETPFLKGSVSCFYTITHIQANNLSTHLLVSKTMT